MNSLLLNLILLVIGMVVVAKSADKFTDSACGIAEVLGVPKVIIGLTLVSFATTSPEFAVSTMAAWMGNVGISFGNPVGSTVANIGLVLAFAAIARPIRIEKEVIVNSLIMLASASLLTFFAFSRTSVDRVEGLILLTFLALFLFFVVIKELKRKGKMGEQSKVEVDGMIRRKELKLSILLFVVGAVGIVVGSRILVYSGVQLALAAGVSEAVVGLTVIAVGTSLPELVTAIMSTYKKVSEITVGNIIGANILNMLWVLGVSSVIRPLTVNLQTIMLSTLTMLVSMALLIAFMRTGLQLSRREGVMLFAIYVLYLVALTQF